LQDRTGKTHLLGLTVYHDHTGWIDAASCRSRISPGIKGRV